MFSEEIRWFENSTARVAAQALIDAGELAGDMDTSNVYRRSATGWTQISIGGAGLVTDGMDGTSAVMLANATATGIAASTQLTAPLKSKCTYIATIGGNNAIAVTATVLVYGSLVPMASAGAADKELLATLTLAGTGVTNNNTVVDTDSIFVGEHYYPYIWTEVSAISGVGAKVITGRRLT